MALSTGTMQGRKFRGIDGKTEPARTGATPVGRWRYRSDGKEGVRHRNLRIHDLDRSRTHARVTHAGVIGEGGG